MFDLLVYLLFVVAGLTLFYSTLTLIIALRLDDRPRVEKLLDLYTQWSAAGASAIIGALKIFRRRERRPELPSTTKSLRPPSASVANQLPSAQHKHVAE
jgi:hypothetical protein